MEIDNTINLGAMPYEILNRLGISPQMADKLPENVKKNLVSGELTPIVNLSIKASNGAVVHMPAKLQIAQQPYGETALMVYPVRNDMSQSTVNNLQLNSNEKSLLDRGDIIVRELKIDGEIRRAFVQLDNETRSAIIRPVDEVPIMHVLKNIDAIKDIHLGTRQRQQAMEGKPIQLELGDTKVTVGVDLKEPQGFKIFKGDLQEWERQQQIKYDIAHPEYIGLVQTEKNKWEYKQVVDNLDPKQKSEQSIKSGGMRR